MAFQVVPPRRQPVFRELVRVVVLHSNLEGELVCDAGDVAGGLSVQQAFWMGGRGVEAKKSCVLHLGQGEHLSQGVEPPSSKHKHLDVPCLGVGNEEP